MVKKTREDLAFPLVRLPDLGVVPKENPAVIKKVIMGAIQGAFGIKSPAEPSKWSADYRQKQKPLVSQEDISLIICVVESLQPTSVIEAILASQFAIAHIRGVSLATSGASYNLIFKCFDFSHHVLTALQRYRTKGAQHIQVHYNHNQAQFNNIKILENSHKTKTGDKNEFND